MNVTRDSSSSASSRGASAAGLALTPFSVMYTGGFRYRNRRRRDDLPKPHGASFSQSHDDESPTATPSAFTSLVVQSIARPRYELAGESSAAETYRLV